MSLETKITLQGHNTVLAIIRDMSKRADDPSGLMARLSILGFQDVMSHFSKQEGATKSGDQPTAWKALSPITIERRRQGSKSGSNKILQDTGVLRNSILPGTRGSRKAVVSTNIIYAGTHQYGRGNIPRRPYMWLSRIAIDKMLAQTLSWVRRGRLL